MSSSFPKHHCLHRFITLLCAFLVAAAFVTIMKKDCRLLPIPDDSKLWSLMVNNQSLQVEYIEHYYDEVQIYHIIIVTIDVFIFLLAFINIAPGQEDIRFGFHLLLIITLGALTLLACYASYTSFSMPCHAAGRIGEKWTTDRQVYQQSHGGRHLTKGTPLNAYVELDYHLLIVTALDAAGCFLFLMSTMFLCGDAREEAIQDEYVARVRFKDVIHSRPTDIYQNTNTSIPRIPYRPSLPLIIVNVNSELPTVTHRPNSFFIIVRNHHYHHHHQQYQQPTGPWTDGSH